MFPANTQSSDKIKFVPGLSVLVDVSGDTQWRSLLRRMYRSPSLNGPLSRYVSLLKESAASEAVVNGDISSFESLLESNGEVTLDKLRLKLDKSLFALRRFVCPEFASEERERAIVACSLSPMFKTEEQRLERANDNTRETLKKARICNTFHVRGRVAFEFGISSVETIASIGWVVDHTYNGKIARHVLSLNLKTGIFSVGDLEIPLLPSSLNFRSCDIIGCILDIDAMTLYYTLNGVMLPHIQLRRRYPNDEIHPDDVSASPLVPNPKTDSTLHSLLHEQHKFTVSIGTDAKWSAYVIGQASTTNFGPSSISIVPDATSAADWSRQLVLSSQCELILDLLAQVMPHVPSKAQMPSSASSSPQSSDETTKFDETRARDKQSPKRKKTLAGIYDETIAIDSEKICALRDLLIYDSQVGLKAVLTADETLAEEVSFSYMMHANVLPFLLRLVKDTDGRFGLPRLEHFISLFVDDDEWSDAFLLGLVHVASGAIVSLPLDVPVHHSEMVLPRAPMGTYSDVAKLMVRLFRNERIFHLLAASSAFKPLLTGLFNVPALDHHLRIEPFLTHEQWSVLNAGPQSETYLEMFVPMREAMHTRISSWGKFLLIWAQHEPSAAKRDAFLRAIGSPTQNSNGTTNNNEGEKNDQQTTSTASGASNNKKKTEERYNPFLLALRAFISETPDMLRAKACSVDNRPFLTALFFGLLAAITSGSDVHRDAVFNNAILTTVLMDPARNNVDRLGGTFGHVASLFPDPFASLPTPTDTEECQEVDFPSARTGWQFEFLDAAAFLFYHAFMPSVTAAQTLSNDVEMHRRVAKNLENTKSGRDADALNEDLDLTLRVTKLSEAHAGLACISNGLDILDQAHAYLLHHFGLWISQVIVHTAANQTRASLLQYFPKIYPQILVAIQNILRIGNSGSTLRFIISRPPKREDQIKLTKEDRDEGDRFWPRAVSSCALAMLVRKKLIINPNLQSTILNHLSSVVYWSLQDEDAISPKRFCEFLDVCFVSFVDSRTNQWTSVLDAMVPFLLHSTDVARQYREHLSSWTRKAENKQPIEAFLNQLFNMTSWTDNELETHIDNYIEKLKLVTSNVDVLIADPNRDPSMERSTELANRSGRQPEERGFKRESARKDWKLTDVGGDRVVVELPVENTSARMQILKQLATLNSGLETVQRESPLYLVVLRQLLFVLSKMVETALPFFEQPMMMKRTCELVSHTLTRTLAQSGSPPLVKLCRLFGNTIREGDTLANPTTSQSFYEMDNTALIWTCVSVIAKLLKNSAAASDLATRSLKGHLSATNIDFILTLSFEEMPEWDGVKEQFDKLKSSSAGAGSSFSSLARSSSSNLSRSTSFGREGLTSSSGGRDALLRSGQEECPICYSNHVNTTFEPCGHRSCQYCIERHLLNSKKCFFCNAQITTTRKDYS